MELTIGNGTLRGVLRNISAGGALLAVRELSPSIHLQPAYIVIKTPVSFLELQGVTHERPSTAETTLQPIKDIVIAFVLSSDRDQEVLQSLLDGLQEGSTTVTFEALILSPIPNHRKQARGGALTQRHATRPTRNGSADGHASHPPCTRSIVRSPAWPDVEPQPGRSLSRTLRPPRLPGGASDHPIIPVGPIAQPYRRSGLARVGRPWTARVIWTRILRINTTSRPETASKGRFRVGVRFENLSTAQEYRLRSILCRRSALLTISPNRWPMCP